MPQWEEAIEILERTPKTLTALLGGLSDPWLHCNEGPQTWSASEVVDHLIEAEHTNWLPRIKLILQGNGSDHLPAFDRYAHLRHPSGAPMEQRLCMFQQARHNNVSVLQSIVHPERHLSWTALHPELGQITLSELLAAWAVHDLSHLSQISRVLTLRCEADVGPWKRFFRAFTSRTNGQAE